MQLGPCRNFRREAVYEEEYLKNKYLQADRALPPGPAGSSNRKSFHPARIAAASRAFMRARHRSPAQPTERRIRSLRFRSIAAVRCIQDGGNVMKTMYVVVAALLSYVVGYLLLGLGGFDLPIRSALVEAGAYMLIGFGVLAVVFGAFSHVKPAPDAHAEP
jgi:hypothetical protein